MARWPTYCATVYHRGYMNDPVRYRGRLEVVRRKAERKLRQAMTRLAKAALEQPFAVDPALPYYLRIHRDAWGATIRIGEAGLHSFGAYSIQVD